jgi:hypothetical protein
MAEEHTKVFQEIVKIGSRIADETDVLKATKLGAAQSVLSSAMTLASVDPTKAKRLTTLARNIAK